jgi:hypothetical protein
LIRRHLDIGAADLTSKPAHNVVKVDVIFERIGAEDVVVVRVRQPHRDAASTVDPAVDSLEAHRDLDVFGGYAVVDRQRKTIVRMIGTALCEHLA